jgi:hypothetical protein
VFPAPVLRSGTCGWRVDLRSHVLFADQPFEGGEQSRDFWLATYRHETAHWVRYQTSSIGLLLTLLLRARAVTGQRALNVLPRDARSRVMRQSLTGTPIWHFGGGFNAEFAGHGFALQGQAWLDLEYAYQLLFDIDTVHMRWSPLEALNSAISDAWRAAASFPGATAHPGNHVADHLVLGAPARVTFRGTSLTTRSLWECASTIDELWFDSRPDAATQRDLERLVGFKLADAVYGGPWLAAKSLCGSALTHEAFLALIHIAANPELPFWTNDMRPFQWDDIYPPTRFLVALRCLADKPQLIPLCGNTGEQLDEFVFRLCRDAGLSYARPLAEGALALDEHPGLNQPVVGDLNAVVRAGLFLRSAWSGSLRRAVFPAFPSVYRSRGDEESMRLTQLVHAASLPILMDFEDGLYASSLLTEQQQGAFCLHAWGHNALDGWIRGNPTGSQQDYLPRQTRVPKPEERFADEYLRGDLLMW